MRPSTTLAIVAVAALQLAAAITFGTEGVPGNHMPTIDPEQNARLQNVLDGVTKVTSKMARITKTLHSYGEEQVNSMMKSKVTVDDDMEETHSSKFKLAHMSPKAHRRVMTEQQRSPSPASTFAPVTINGSGCGEHSAYRVLVWQMFRACQRVDFGAIFPRGNPNKHAINNALNRVCSTECAGAVNALLNRTENYVCMDDSLHSFLQLFAGTCTVEPSSGDRCGAVVASSGFMQENDCESSQLYWSQSKCKANSRCQWNTKSQHCELILTNAYIEGFCGFCGQKMLGTLLDPFFQVLICAKRGSDYCFPTTVEARDWYKSHEVDYMCQTGNERYPACRRGQNAAVINLVTEESWKWFHQCNGSRVLYCYDSYLSSLRVYGTIYDVADSACTKNATDSSSRYCTNMTSTSTAYLSSLYYCPYGTSYTTHHANCSYYSSCNSYNERWSKEINCCAGLTYSYQSVPTAIDIPYHRNQPRRISGYVQDYGKAVFNKTAIELCSTSGSGAFSYNQNCDAQTARSNSSTMQIWTYLDNGKLKASPEVQANVYIALRMDLANACGVSYWKIQNIATEAATSNGVTGTLVKWTINGLPQRELDDAATFFKGRETHFPRTMYLIEAGLCPDCLPASTHYIVAAAISKIDGVKTPICMTDAFVRRWLELKVVCDSVADPFSLRTSSLSLANSTWAGLCVSECLNRFRNITTDPQIGHCVDSETVDTGNVILAGCTQGSDRLYCGSVMTVLASVNCYRRPNQTSCLAEPLCRWNWEKYSCGERYTEEFLSPICDGGCVTTLAVVLGGDSNEFALSARLLDSVYCSKDKGSLCLPAIQSEFEAMEETSIAVDASPVTTICESGTKRRCAKRVYMGLSSYVIDVSEYHFFSCVEAVVSYQSYELAHNYDYYVYTYCLPPLLYALFEVETSLTLMNNMCSRNPRDRTLCLTYPASYGRGSCIWNLVEGYCSSSCLSSVDAAFTSMGCCSGNIQEVFGAAWYYNEYAVPDFSDHLPQELLAGSGSEADGPTPSPYDESVFHATTINHTSEVAVAYPTRGVFRQYYWTCQWSFPSTAAHKVGNLVGKKCAKVRVGTAQNISLDLSVSFSELDADVKLKSRFMYRLALDLGNKLGLSLDDFVGHKLASRSSSSRRMTDDHRGMAEQASSTTTMSSSVQTENSEDTQAAIDSYNAQVAAGNLTLTSSSSVASNQCANCTTGTSVSTAAKSTVSTIDQTPEPATPSGASLREAAVAIFSTFFVIALSV
jgi:hypothetical protein